MSICCVEKYCDAKETQKFCAVCYAKHCKAHSTLGFECLECHKWCCMDCVGDPIDEYICKVCKN